jgi:tetratricopeptide (TPR) repeat protein
MEGIVQEEPDYYWGWQQLAEWYSEAGRSEDYLRAANEMVRLRPESPYSLARRGEALILTGERESGKADLRQAQKLAPDYPLPGMLLFDEQLADEEFEQAADTLAILQEHVGDDFVSARQCQLACRQNDRDAALDAFRYLCESPVEATWPITTAFGAVRAAGWGDEAETILRESLESRLFNPHLAILWLDTPSADEAPEEERLNVLDRAISRHPRYLPLYDRKAELLSRMDRYDEAAATCRPAGFDDLPLILRGRAAWVEFQRGNRDRGIELMRECVANAPDYYWGWQQLANWFETTEQFSGYLESAEQMVRLAPRDPTAFGYRGEARLRTGDREGAKADFRRAYEMDPEYGFAGLHLLDEQLNDNEIEDAAETLARLRERGDDAYIRLRALRLAIAQQDQDEALRMLEEYVGDDDTPPPMFARALELLDEAGWQADVDRVLAARLDDDDAAEPAARAWVERKLAQGLPDEILPRVTRWLERDDDVGREALLAYLEGIARNRDKPRLFECIDRFTEAFREETLSWGKVGWALTRVHEYTRAADWMHDWPEREDPGSWMLINLAICLRAIDRDTEAAAVSLHARQNADPDFTSPFHDIWLALDEALAGHTAAAAEAIDPVVARRGDLDDYFRMVLAMVEGLLMVQQAPRGQKSGAFAIARTMLDKAGKDYAGLDPDPALTKAWDKMVRRLARDTFSISAWLWSRKARGKPPFPTTPKD